MSEAGRIIGLYERNAAQWDKDRGKNLFERGWLDRFIALLPQNPRVLDIGCGSGEPIARYLIERGCRVTGVDSSEAMIAMCAARFPDHRWTAADMRDLDLGVRFDGIIAWDSFFHLTREDQRAMFPVFAKHAALGAALMFTSGPHDGEAIGEMWGEPLYHSSLAPDEYRALLNEQGFEVAAYTADDKACGGHTIWLAQSPDRG